MNHTPFAIRVAAVPFRLVGYVVRALLMWAGADLAATAVFGVVFFGVLLALVTLPPLNRWIGRRVAAHWQRQRSERMWQELNRINGDRPDGIHDGHTQILPALPDPATPPPVRSALRRRRMPGVRIPGRPLRRTHSNSKRKARP